MAVQTGTVSHDWPQWNTGLSDALKYCVYGIYKQEQAEPLPAPALLRENFDATGPGLRRETGGFPSLISQANAGWAFYTSEKLYAIAGVESVYIGVEAGEIHVWIVIAQRDILVLERIYQVEEDIYDLLSPRDQPLFLLDFHVIYRNGRTEKDLLPGEAILLSK